MMNYLIQYSENTEGQIEVYDYQQPVLVEHNAPEMIPTLKLVLPSNPIHGQPVQFTSVNGVEQIEMVANKDICSPRKTLERIRYGEWVYSGNSDKWLRLK